MAPAGKDNEGQSVCAKKHNVQWYCCEFNVFFLEVG